ncbi:MAG: hypothetical protein ACREJ3_04860 [Polyangiaceae bacterium]
MWHDDRLAAFSDYWRGSEPARLRALGLRIIGRSHKLEIHEWSAWVLRGLTPNGPHAAAWADFTRECQQVADRYGITVDAVKLGALVKDWQPRPAEWPFFPIAAVDPWLRVVTDFEDADHDLFMRWLIYHGSALSLRVNGWVPGDWPRPADPLGVDGLPPLARAFRMHLELPPDLPPPLAAQWAREAAQVARELAARLGYPPRRRMRSRTTSLRD